MNKKIFVSLLTIVMCLALIAGSTYALFTSEDKIDIAVTSGQVKVTATVGNLKLYSMDKEMQPAADGSLKFENGGTAEILAESHELVLSNVTPGDKATFDITVKNDSNVTIKYRLVWTISGELAEALVINNQDLDWTVWEIPATEEEKVETISVSIALPTEFADQTKKNASISFKVEAIQGNADVDEMVSSEEELRKALEEGAEDILLIDDIVLSEGFNVKSNANINGNGYTIARTSSVATCATNEPTVYTGTVFNVAAGTTLTLENITVDGGAVWTGEIDPVLGRGTVNSGVTATGNLIATVGNANVVLNDGVIIQNNDGVNAISLATRGGGSLTINGAEIINNSSAAGAIWGGDDITFNSGKINGNYATTIGGAIRFVDGQSARTIHFTMNGGEMNHNYSAGNGGAIWSGHNLVAHFNGGEVAYNKAAIGGGAVWGGNQDTYYITGDFEMHHNVAGELGNAFRLSHFKWIPVEFEMTGGHIYANDAESGGCAIFANNNPVFLLGGVVDDVISYNGNDYITVGNTEIKGLLEFNHDGRGDYKILLDKEFKGINFVVEEDDALFEDFMLDPAEGYTYTEGDEAKLVCMNEGYETYWDAATGTFRLQATN